jgi:glucan biosynthesis protein C
MRWLDGIPAAAARWGSRAVVFASVAMLLIEVAAHGLSSASAEAKAFGGWNWHALLYAMWEPWVLVGMSLILLSWGQKRLNQPSRRWQGWAEASYLAYIIQPLVLVPAAVLLQGAAWPALAKFVVVAALAVVVAYSLARALRLVPVVRRVVG